MRTDGNTSVDNSVEICNQVNSIKYVYNGHDRAQVYMDSNATEEQDEVKSFLDARYVSAAEVRWRIFSFLMHKESSFCQRLDIHLPGDRILTAWFKYNANNIDDEETRDITYPDFCEKCIFHVESRPRFWSSRRAGFRGTIGCVYTVSPRNIEKYHYSEGFYYCKFLVPNPLKT
ncbi:hypothetical protein INT46_009137 [Mucor plumbeus]|uniref:Uncharacterized protein n=1 Tax=Mucor plumbeus TaxID=97098 RepID=A0A8H7QC88_9FUNG|nr:hypothetical protein INT46_009137 [Mucor plumbeus]